jgi:hypothetical protein
MVGLIKIEKLRKGFTLKFDVGYRVTPGYEQFSYYPSCLTSLTMVTCSDPYIEAVQQEMWMFTSLELIV